MIYKYLDKFEIKGANFKVEVLGIFPGGQRRTLQYKDNSYRILLNGIEIDITEQNLDLLKQAGKIEEKEEEIPPIQLDEPIKRGRPKKS